MSSAWGTFDVVVGFGREMSQTSRTEAVVAAEELGFVSPLVVHFEADVTRQHIGVVIDGQALTGWGRGRHHTTHTQTANVTIITVCIKDYWWLGEAKLTIVEWTPSANIFCFFGCGGWVKISDLAPNRPVETLAHLSLTYGSCTSILRKYNGEMLGNVSILHRSKLHGSEKPFTEMYWYQNHWNLFNSK